MIWIIGFGTLLLKHSLGDTVGSTNSDGKEYIPVTIRNYKRLFNVVASHYTPTHKLTDSSIETAAANVEFAREESFNGVAFRVSEEELAQLDVRERYYQRVQVEAYHFGTDRLLGDAYVYCALPSSQYVETRNEKLLPHWRDIDYARRGAYAIGPEFGKAYDASTYMADGVTRMVDFYQGYLTTDPTDD